MKLTGGMTVRRILVACACMLLWTNADVLADSRNSVLNYHQAFDDLGFLADDFVARSGLKTPEERGMTVEEGKFGRGIRMNLTPKIVTLHEMSGADLDMVTGAMFRTGARRKHWTTDNEPFLWGAGKINPLSGAVAFWVKGPLREGVLFNQSAMRCGRPEQYLLSITVDSVGKLGAYVEDARYVRHSIASSHRWDANEWNQLVLNWDRAEGLELFVNGASVASSWGKDSWWETTLPGLMHLPMPHVVYDELFTFSRPLAVAEIKRLMDTNTPPDGTAAVPRRSRDAGSRLAVAFGISPDAAFPVATPLPEGKVLRYREITPEFTGDGNIPDRFCQDGRYELAWPHPLAVFTPIPGDASYQAEKLDVVPPKGVSFNYVTIEGNLTGLPAALTGCTRSGDRYTGKTFFSIPEDARHFHVARLDNTPHGKFTLPFLKGYGTPPPFSGDLHLPLTGDTRIQELGLFDVAVADDTHPTGEMTCHFRTDGSLAPRYDFAMRALNPLADRAALFGYVTRPSGTGREYETGYLTRTSLVTAPVAGLTCIGGIGLDCEITTAVSEDILLVRLRDPALPHRIWTHAEVRLQGFRNGGRLRLLLEPPPLMLAAGDAVWLEIATAGNARIRIGGPDGARVVLKPAPFHDSVTAYETKALMPCLAECTKAHYQPWLFEKVWPDLMNPHVYGGHFDAIMPALAVARVLPHSRVAAQYIDLGNLPEGHLGELKKIVEDKDARSAFDEKNIPADVPRWAWLQRHVQHFRWRVAQWMASNQNPDGQLGEGWNDDVFMYTQKYDILLDGLEDARLNYLNYLKHYDETRILGDGWVRISPLDSLHTWDFHCEQWQSMLMEPGDPYTVRRMLKSAWHLGKPDRTPRHYNAGEPFMYAENILNWYWGTGPRHSHVTADPAAIEGRLLAMAKNCDDIHFHRFTEAWNTFHDLSGERTLTGMILGGWAHSTRSPHVRDRSISVSWPEGGGWELSRWVTRADSVSLSCRIYSFDPLERKVTARLYRMDPGNYEVSLRRDQNGTAGETVWSQKVPLMRYDTVTVDVPPGTPLILEITRLSADRKGPVLPDLAVAAYDCERTGTTVKVRVSNVGGMKSPASAVVVFDASGKKLAERPFKALDAPRDYVERSVVATFTGMPATGALRIAVDEGNRIPELYKGNNVTFLP